MSNAIALGTRRELFFDHFLIAALENARLQLSHPERHEVAFTADAPWENWTFGAYSLVAEGDLIRMYYRAAIPDLKNEDHTITALAESRDGARSFTRPRLGRWEFNGSRDNNILKIGGKPGVPPLFLDRSPACLPAARYKGLTSEWQKLYAVTSADGLAWQLMQPEPIAMPGTFDTINTAFWDTELGKYRCYTRYFNAAHKPKEGLAANLGARAIQMATSDDFLHWSAPAPLEYEDGDMAMQMYTNAVIPCPGAPHLYLGFPNRIIEDRNKVANQPFPGANDALFMASRDGVHWTRYPEAWVRPGLDPRNWTQRNNYPTWPLLVTEPDEWTVLISEHYMQKDRAPARLRRLSVRPWGLVSVRAEMAGGTLLTKPLLVGGRQLRLNYATSAAGSLQLELQDADGHALPGYALADMSLMYGDELDAVVTWPSGSDLSALRDRPVRLRFVLRDADLYALRFTDGQ